MLGIICGLESEAVVARRCTDSSVIVAGARPQQARWGARELVKKGATQLLSFGLAGGLAPDLPAGSLIIGTSVITKDGHWNSDTGWNDLLMRRLPTAQCGGVWGCETIIATTRDKRAIYERSHALIADMESQCVAQIAQEADMPFAVLRVVTDTYNMDMPAAALVPLKINGHVDLTQVLWSLLHSPTQLPHLIRLGLNTGKAMQQLREAVRKAL